MDRYYSDTEKLAETLIQLGRFMMHFQQNTEKDHSSTMLQTFVLHFIQSNPNISIKDLVKILNISKSSATQLIERLVKSGFVKRDYDKEDRRIIHLKITSKGETELVILKKKKIDKIKHLFSKVPPEDIKELIRIHTNLLMQIKKENI